MIHYNPFTSMQNLYDKKITQPSSVNHSDIETTVNLKEQYCGYVINSKAFSDLRSNGLCLMDIVELIK